MRARRDGKPAILEAFRRRPVTCATSCYETESGRWIHHPWNGCTTIKLEESESRPKVSVWHKGDVSLEPIYRLVGNDEMGAAVCCYYCPICGKEFIRRKACLSHITDCLERNWKEENHGFK